MTRFTSRTFFRSDAVPRRVIGFSLKAGILLLAFQIATLSGEIVAYPDSNSAEKNFSMKIVINLPERMLRVYRTATLIDDFTPAELEFPIAIGMKRWPTPTMESMIEQKTTRPAWHAPRTSWAGEHAGQVVPFDSGANPFRARNARGGVEGYFLAIGSDGIGLHSTSERKSIGRLASHGCIRMRLEDVRVLYRTIPIGTSVSIVYKLHRAIREGSSIRVQSFKDVYHRIPAEERAAELHRHLLQHRIDPLEISEELLARAVTGKEIQFTDSEKNSTVEVRSAPDSSQEKMLELASHRQEKLHAVEYPDACRMLAAEVWNIDADN